MGIKLTVECKYCKINSFNFLKEIPLMLECLLRFFHILNRILSEKNFFPLYDEHQRVLSEVFCSGNKFSFTMISIKCILTLLSIMSHNLPIYFYSRKLWMQFHPYVYQRDYTIA